MLTDDFKTLINGRSPKKKVKKVKSKSNRLSKKKSQIKRDLDMLNKPLIDGNFNLCYGDGYFSKSLERKYSATISELMEAIKEEEFSTATQMKLDFETDDEYDVGKDW